MASVDGYSCATEQSDNRPQTCEPSPSNHCGNESNATLTNKVHDAVSELHLRVTAAEHYTHNKYAQLHQRIDALTDKLQIADQKASALTQMNENQCQTIVKLRAELAKTRNTEDDRIGAWMAVVEALGTGWNAHGSSGLESAVNLIRELQRKAVRLDRIEWEIRK